MTDFGQIRSQFAILNQRVNNHPLVYLDSAATAQKPTCVLEAEQNFYLHDNAGVHRGAHTLAARATEAYEQARAEVSRFIGASYSEGSEELVVTSGATAGMNLLANAIGNASLPSSGADPRFVLHEGDEIVISRAEHHSVLLTMQELAKRTGATLRWFDADSNGRLLTEQAGSVITERTKIVAITHISNVTGAITDLAPVVARAHEVGALVILDMCQSVPHIPIDVHALDVDFAVFSAHKMYGPTGVGFLYGKRELLESLPTPNFGGSMVELAWMDAPAQYMAPPAKFEAGTQPVAQVVAVGAAAKWLGTIGMDEVARHEQLLTERLLSIGNIEGIRILGPTDTANRIGTVAFSVDGVHPHDVGQYVDAQGIAIRVGHHCAQPIHRHFGIYASNRASCGVYNTIEDIDALIEALSSVRAYFGVS